MYMLYYYVMEDCWPFTTKAAAQRRAVHSLRGGCPSAVYRIYYIGGKSRCECIHIIIILFVRAQGLCGISRKKNISKTHNIIYNVL